MFHALPNPFPSSLLRSAHHDPAIASIRLPGGTLRGDSSLKRCYHAPSQEKRSNIRDGRPVASSVASWAPISDVTERTSGGTTIALKSNGRNKRYEGAALIHHMNKYIAAGSGVEGWNPTDTSYAAADAPLGPYRQMGRIGEDRTWNSQISKFLYIAESDKVLAVCDQWFRGPKGDRVPVDESCQLWLPLSFDPAIGVAKMLHVDEWSPWK